MLNADVLRHSTKRTPSLSEMQPHSRPEHLRIDTRPVPVDQTRSIAIRNDSGERQGTMHASRSPVCICRVNGRRMESHADFARGPVAGGGRWPNANASSARPRLSYQIAFSMAVHCCSPQPCLARLPRGQSYARGPIENSVFPFAQNSRANSKTSAASRPCGAIARRPFPEL